jgi:preprotein translocase subunit SecE
MAENEKKLRKADEGDKPAKKKQPSKLSQLFTRTVRGLREMRGELKKVKWPTPKQTANNTLIVILCVLVIGAFIWAFDWLAGNGVQALIAIIRG